MPDFSKRLEKADKYLQKGRQADALDEYLEVLQEDPNQDGVRQSAADLSMALGKNAEENVRQARIALAGCVGSANENRTRI